MTGFERQRLTMVESQLRPNEVTDTRLLAAMRALPRERFVPRKLKPLAYMDEGIEVFPSVDGAPARGHQEAGPYDVILLNGSVPELPENLILQLKEGGRLAVVMANGANSGSQGEAYLFVTVGGEASGVPHFAACAR